MAGVFNTQKDVIAKKDRQSIFEEVAAELMKKPSYIPEEVPMKALFYGDDGTGKSGTAFHLVDMINKEEGEKVLVVDLDIGDEPVTQTYHKQSYVNQNLIVWDPMWWDEVTNPEGDPDVEINYRRTMARIKAAGVWIKTHWEEEKIRAVIFDGLSTLLQHAEYQMRIDKNLDTSGGVSQRYWVNRNKSFLEMIQLYKSIPLDVIFIGNYKFGLDINSADVAKVYRDIHDTVFQKVGFRIEETADGKVEFWAKIEKSKQALKHRGRQVKFASVDLDNQEADYYWDPAKVIKLLRPDPYAQNSATDIASEEKPKDEKSLEAAIEDPGENKPEESDGKILGDV